MLKALVDRVLELALLLGKVNIGEKKLKARYNKVFQTLAVTFLLALLAAAIPAKPALAQSLEITQAQRKIGEKVDIWGSQFNVSAQVVIYFSDEAATVGERIDTDVLNYEKVVASTYTTGIGELFAYFIVPSELTDGDDPDTKVRGGSHYVYLTYYGLKQIVAFDSFTVESTGEITLDPEEGAVGIEVEITGEGFDEEEGIAVEYDGDDIDIASGDDETDNDGEFEDTTITIPPSTAGDHTITVIGDDSDIEATATFTVEPQITIAPQSGAVGDSITVNGTGFGDRVDVRIFFDDEEVVYDETTDSAGSFEVTFAALSRAPGSYDVEAEDEDGNSDKVKFAMAPSISLSPTSGYPGTEVIVGGTGFRVSSSITITFGDTSVATNTTDADGRFSTSFSVPSYTSGTYRVKVSDGSNTVEADFSISTSTSISPVTSAASPGHVGTELTIGGIGFVAGRTLIITYDGNQVATATVLADGTFTATFNAPASVGGEHSIMAIDGTNTIPFTFVMESTPPLPVYPQLPLMDTKLEKWRFDWCGDATDLSKEVTDDSLPITYTLQIATSLEDFEGSIVRERTGLTDSEYTLAKEERLESVSKENPYYWRVKARDAASNEVVSGVGSFYVGFSFALPKWAIYTLSVVGALVLFILGFWVGRKTAYY